MDTPGPPGPPKLNSLVRISLNLLPSFLSDRTRQHDVVLDYITTRAFASTAMILSQPRTSSSAVPEAGETMAVDDDSGAGPSGSSRKAEKRPMRDRESLVDAQTLQSMEHRRGKPDAIRFFVASAKMVQ